VGVAFVSIQCTLERNVVVQNLLKVKEQLWMHTNTLWQAFVGQPPSFPYGGAGGAIAFVV
jgi:hypothetical protein